MAKERNTQPKRTTSSLAANTKSLFDRFTSGFSSGQRMVLFSSVSLILVGIVMVYSASSIESISNGTAVFIEPLKQVLFVVVGVAAVMFLAWLLTNEAWAGRFIWSFYLLTVILVFVAGFFGVSQYGASRWIAAGPFTVQPSEFAKVSFVLLTAHFFRLCQEGEFERTRFGAFVAMIASRVSLVPDNTRGQLVLSMGITLFLPIGVLVVFQSDLGTTMICLVGIFALVWSSGVFSKQSLLGFVVIIALLGVVMIALFPYRMARITTVLNPWADADGDGYQLVHSFKALASGGLFGVGIGASYQKLLYLPMASTDYIFAIIGEEMGLLGCCVIIALFVVLLVGGLKIASEAPSWFGGLVASSLAIMIVFQAFLNIACVTGLFPTTGKPLPFISSGGSSMVSSVMTVGIILLMGVGTGDVHERRRNQLGIVSAVEPGTTNRRSAGHIPEATASRHVANRARSSSRNSTRSRAGLPARTGDRGSDRAGSHYEGSPSSRGAAYSYGRDDSRSGARRSSSRGGRAHGTGANRAQNRRSSSRQETRSSSNTYGNRDSRRQR